MLPKMRTIQEAAAWLHEQDPDTCIGEGFIRRRVKEGKLPVIRAGNRQLINLSSLVAFLEGGKTVQNTHVDDD